MAFEEFFDATSGDSESNSSGGGSKAITVKDVLNAITAEPVKRPDPDPKYESLAELLKPAALADAKKLLPVLCDAIVQLRVKLEGRSFEVHSLRSSLEKASNKRGNEGDNGSKELEIASVEVRKLRLENVRLKGENAGLEAANKVLQGEVEEALRGVPVGLPSKPEVKDKAKAKKQQPEAAQKTDDPEPEEKKSFLSGICETVLERMGTCTRGADGGPCELKHPPDCTKPACHAKGGRKATECQGWHLFKKYSELTAERKDRAESNKKKKAASKKAAPNKQPVKAGSKKSEKGNGRPRNKAAPSGQQQRHKNKKGGGLPQDLPVGHSEWAAQRPPMARHGRQSAQFLGLNVAQPGAHQQPCATQFYQAPQQHTQPGAGQQQVQSGFQGPMQSYQYAPQFAQHNPYAVLGNMNFQ